MLKNEKSVVNDAIQYWKGFLDALMFLRKNSIEEIDAQIIKIEELIAVYKERLRVLKRNKNASRNRRN